MGVPVCAFASKGNARRINAVIETDTYQKHLESVLILNAPRHRFSNRLTFSGDGVEELKCHLISKMRKWPEQEEGKK
jgi:hypothetical protein